MSTGNWQAWDMGDYLGLVIALAIGLPLLGVALWFDRRRERQRLAELAAAPQRGDPAVDALTPAYVTQDEVDRLPLPGTGRRAEDPAGSRFSFGLAAAEFATTTDAAEYSNIRVLMIDGNVEAFRELLAPLAGVSDDAPMAIVAHGFHPEVLQTLAANRRVLRPAVLAATASGQELSRLQALVGGELLSAMDLKAGYVPDDALGRARRWVSSRSQSWVEAAPAP